MDVKAKKYPDHACQKCGSESKLVETVIDDEFCWDEDIKTYQPRNFTDTFQPTGVEIFAICACDWTGSS